MTQEWNSEAERQADRALSGLLVVQIITLFVALPLGAVNPVGRALMDLCHLAFAFLCTQMLTKHPAVRIGLVVGVVLLALGPATSRWTESSLGGRAFLIEDLIALVAFAFNALVTALVFRRVFSPGPVNAQRVQGAVLLYLNVAALFAIAYGVIETHLPGSFVSAGGTMIGTGRGVRTAALSYFSLTTITTTGYGDLAPIHPLARSLANLEGVFGQLYPATLLARLVGLHLLTHGKPIFT